MDVLLRKPRMLIGQCDIPQNVPGRYFSRSVRFENGNITTLKYRFGLLYKAWKQEPELYIISHGFNDAKLLPGFKRKNPIIMDILTPLLSLE